MERERLWEQIEALRNQSVAEKKIQEKAFERCLDTVLGNIRKLKVHLETEVMEMKSMIQIVREWLSIFSYQILSNFEKEEGLVSSINIFRQSIEERNTAIYRLRNETRALESQIQSRKQRTDELKQDISRKMLVDEQNKLVSTGSTYLYFERINKQSLIWNQKNRESFTNI